MIIQGLYSKIKDPLYKNALHLILTSILTTGLGFFFWLIIARFYPPEQVGLGSVLISCMLLLAMLSTLGFRIALIRFLPQSKKGVDMINSCFTISIMISIILGSIFWLLRDIVASSIALLLDNPLFILLFITFTVVWTLTGLLDSVFISKRVAKYTLFKNSAFGLLKIPLPLFVTMLGAFGIFLSWGISATLIFILASVFLLPKVQPDYIPKLMIERSIINDMLHFSIGNYIAEIFASLPALLLPLMIANILSPSTAAYFYIAWMIAGLINIISSATLSSLLAEASLDENYAREKIKKAIKFIFLLLIPAILIVFIFAEKLLLLFGSPYSENATTLLRIFALAGIPFAFNRIYLTVKNIRKEVRIVAIINGIIAFFTLGLSYLLIGRMGITGVGVGWIVAHIVINAFLLLNFVYGRLLRGEAQFSK